MNRADAIAGLAVDAAPPALRTGELLAFYIATAAAFDGACPTRRLDALMMAQKLRELDLAQLDFLDRLRNAPVLPPQVTIHHSPVTPPDRTASEERMDLLDHLELGTPLPPEPARTFAVNTEAGVMTASGFPRFLTVATEGMSALIVPR